MSGVNKVIIIGRMGNDPETKYTPAGVCICKISLATSEKWKDKQTGQPVEKTEWHQIDAFGKLAEIMGQYLKKGSQVYIEGSIHTRKWQAQDGTDRYSTSIKANNMQMLDGKQDGQQQAPQRQQAPQQPAPQQRQPQQQQAPQQPQAGDFHNFDPDMPF